MQAPFTHRQQMELPQEYKISRKRSLMLLSSRSRPSHSCVAQPSAEATHQRIRNYMGVKAYVTDASMYQMYPSAVCVHVAVMVSFMYIKARHRQHRGLTLSFMRHRRSHGVQHTLVYITIAIAILT